MVLALGLAVVACSEKSTPGASGAIPDNAAPAYLDIRDRLGDDFIGVMTSAKTVLTPQVEQQLKDNKQLLTELLAATKAPRCDFKVDYSSGYNTLLSHLGPMRQLAYTLALDARYHAEEGDRAGAAERLAALVRLANATSDMPMMIEKLIGYATLALALETANNLADEGLLSKSDMKPILDALDDIDTNDPLNARQTINSEKRSALLALRDPSTAAELASELSRVPEAERRAAMTEAESLFATLDSAWTQPGAPQRMDRAINAIRSRALKGLAPNMSGIWNNMDDARSNIKRFQQRFS
ncbi:MAG: hypothetical protein EA380_11585 [Phycisphaeraceae bacterium]|nr:MAG: hypothetical protein EA380_11585 [Phycisphaeraceae bacterium]